MSRRNTTLILAAVVLTGAVAVALGQAGVLPALLQRPAEARGVVVVPDRFLRPWDPVTIFFPGTEGTPGPADDPAPLARVSPAHPGAWRWLDAKTLQFRPAEPWPPLSTVTVKADGRTTALQTMMTPPRVIEPRPDAQDLPPVQQVRLTFDTALDPADLARMLTLELRTLPGRDGTAPTVLDQGDFTVKPVQRNAPHDPAVYAVTLRRPVPAGTRATLRLGLARGAAEDAVFRSTFTTRAPFRVESLGCVGETRPVAPGGTLYADDAPMRCADERAVVVRFNAEPRALGPVEARNLVRFAPAVDDLEVSLRGRALVLSGTFEPERAYRVRVQPTGLTDEAGRPLEMGGPSAVSLFFAARPAYLRWLDGAGVVERFGPQRLPLQGRGLGRADLRVHRVAPLDRGLWPFPPRPVEVDESQRPPGPGEEPGAWEAASPVPTNELLARLRALGTPGVSTLVDLPLGSDGRAATFGLDLAPHLTRLGGEGEPGHYLVGLRTLEGEPTRAWLRLQVTDLVLTTLEEADAVRFVVTSMRTGKPVSDARVRLEGEVRVAAETHWETLLRGETDAAGAFRWKAPGAVADRAVTPRRLVVQKGDDVLVLDVTRPPEQFVNGRWRSGGDWLTWAFADLKARRPAPTLNGHIFTERPIYRPEHTVQIKGWLRRRHEGKLTPVTDGAGRVEIRGPGSAEWKLPVTLDTLGGFHVAWHAEEPPTGVYEARYVHSDGSAPDSTTFKVEAYRVPRFAVHLDAVEQVPSDRPFPVALRASYYAGGEVTDRPVRWRVSQYPYAWRPAEVPGFRFSSDARFGGGDRFEASPAMQRTDTTDRAGQAALTLDPTVEPNAQPRTYVVEATVTGADDQTVTATRRVHAVPPFVVGLKVPRYLPRATHIDAGLLVAGPDGKPLAGQEVVVRLLRRQWHSHLKAGDFSRGEARYVTDVVDEPVLERSVKSEDNASDLRLPVEVAGVYVVEASARDALGRTQVVSVDLYAGGEGAVAWEKPKAGVFELSTPQRSYDPGQTAQVVLRSPFQQADALLVIEAPDGNRYRWVKVDGGKATVAFEVERAWAPGVPVHVVLMRGRTRERHAREVGDLDLGKPTTVASSMRLPVSAKAHGVTVTLTHPKQALPGRTVPLTIELADEKGRPLAGQVTLWLVDEAILALADEAPLDPLPDFLTRHTQRLRVRDTRNLAFGRIPFAVMPGGDEGGDEGGPLDRATVRRDFDPVPFYAPALKVGPSGKLVVPVTLSDDLTRFRVRAKAATTDRFGVGTGAIEVRLPLIVQPALPRFVRPGDAFAAAGVGRVVDGPAGPGQAQIAVEGLALAAGGDTATVEVDWPEKDAHRVRFPVEVPTPTVGPDGAAPLEAITVRMGVERAADGATDAFAVTLPLREDRAERVERSLLTLGDGDLEVPGPSEEARPGTVRRTVVVTDAPGVVRLAAALDVLRRAPIGNTETRLARARALMALGDLRAVLGLDDPDATVKAAVTDTLTWLPSVIDDAGHVAWWPGGTGRVSLTAWSLLFVVEAEAAGHGVDGKLRARLASTLAAALRSDHGRFLDGEAWFERSLALEALAAHGGLDDAYFAELARNAQLLGHEGRARAVLAAVRGGRGDDPAVGSLANALAEGILLQQHRGEKLYGGLKGERARSPLIPPGEVRTMGAMSRALAATRKDDVRATHLLDALVRLGTADGWGSVHADAHAILALTDALRRREGPSATVVYDDGTAHPLTLTADAPVAHLASAAAPTKAMLRRAGGDGPLVALVTTRYVPAADGASQDPAQAGFALRRSTATLDAEARIAERKTLEKGGETLVRTVGTVEEHTLEVVNPSERHHVAITLPLAAGVEPMNPALATAAAEATPSAPPTMPADFVEFLDDRVVWHYLTLPKGTYTLRVRTRATVPGTFTQPPATVWATYQPALRARSAGARVQVTP